MVRFAQTATATPRRGGRAERWTHAESMALLQAVEPWGGPERASVVTVHDRSVAIRPTDVPSPHAALVGCGRHVAALDLALRAMGRIPRVHIDDGAQPPVVTVSAGGRRAVSGRDLARRRAEHRWHAAPQRPSGRVDGQALVRIVTGAETGGGRLCLLNGPSRHGAPVWCPPGDVPGETWGFDLPWARDPVLAACARGAGARSAIVAGLVAHRAGVEAARHAHQADLHPLLVAQPPPTAVRRALAGTGADDADDDGEPWWLHALVHVRG